MDRRLESVPLPANEVPRVAHRDQPWYGAYMAALFESEPNKIQERIRRAEQLAVARERQLFLSPATSVERQALNAAIHALRALRGCCKY